jgi:hypothetical protein
MVSGVHSRFRVSRGATLSYSLAEHTVRLAQSLLLTLVAGTDSYSVAGKSQIVKSSHLRFEVDVGD